MSHWTYTSASGASTMASEEAKITTPAHLRQTIPLFIDFINRKVPETQKAEAKYEEWCFHASHHIDDLEMKQQCTFEYNAWKAIEDEIHNFYIYKHDILTAVIRLQQHVKAVRRELAEMLKANGDWDRLVDDVDVEGWMPNCKLERRGFYAAENPGSGTVSPTESEPWYEEAHGYPLKVTNVLEFLKKRDEVVYEEEEDDMCSSFEISEEEWLEDMRPVVDWIEQVEVW